MSTFYPDENVFIGRSVELGSLQNTYVPHKIPNKRESRVENLDLMKWAFICPSFAERRFCLRGNPSEIKP